MINKFPTYDIEKELHSTGYLRVAGVDEVGRGCEHPSGEVLTNNGWKFYKDIDINLDKVLSYTKDGVMVWQNIDFVVEKDFEGELLSLSNRSVSMLVTKDHSFDVLRRTFKRDENYTLRMTGYTYGRRSYVTDLKNNDFIPRGGKWVGDDKDFFILPAIKKSKHDSNSTCDIEKQIPMDLWLKFIGIYLAEGSTVFNKDRGDYIVVISQFKEKQRIKIYNELKKLPFNVKLKKRGIIIYSKQLVTYVRQFGHCYDKYVPKDLKNLPPHRLGTLLDWMLLGDGTSYKYDNQKRVYIYYTTSKQLRDDVEEIILKLNKTYKTTVRPSRDGYINGRKLPKENTSPCFEIRLRYNTKISAKYLHKKFIKYKGKVFCLGLPKHHNFYIRREGSGYFTGNCLAGPVVAAAVYIPPENVPNLIDKVHDSKQLSSKKRNELAKLIKENCFYGIGEIGPDVVDEINILRATEQAMALALSKLYLDSNIDYDYVLIDGTVKLPMVTQPQRQVIKGDAKVLSIAAASIIAKTYRDNKILDMSNLDYYNLWDISNNKGYGTKKHRDAIKEYGLSDLHRRTFGMCKEYTQDDY